MVGWTAFPLWSVTMFVNKLGRGRVWQLASLSLTVFGLTTYLAIQRVGHERRRLHAHRGIYRFHS